MLNRFNTNGSRMKSTHVVGILKMSLVALLLLVVIFGAEQASQAEAVGIDGSVLSTSVASDTSGNIFYLDTAHSQLYEVSNGGTQTQIPCCDGLAIGLNKPRGLALDSQNNLYIADTGNNRIVEINSSSQASVVNLGLYRLLGPSGIAVDANSDIYIADTGNNRILEIPAIGGQVSVVNTENYPLSNPSSVAIDQNNTLYITDTDNNRIVAVPSSGSPSALFSNQLRGPFSMTLDGNGNAYIAHYYSDAPSSQGNSNGNGEIPAVISTFSALNLNVDAGGGSQGTVATANITLTPMGGFSDTVYLSVVGLPPNVIMQLTHPIVSFKGNEPVVEQLLVGESTQQSRLFDSNRLFTLRGHRSHMFLAGLLPFSLLMLVGFRASSRKLAGACKVFGILTLLLLLPAITMTTSGCAGGYPAGLFGTATYTATLIATPANGKPYSLGSFGVTMAN